MSPGQDIAAPLERMTPGKYLSLSRRAALRLALAALVIGGAHTAQAQRVLTLHDYAARGDVENVARRIRAGRVIDRPSARHRGRTALLLAAEHGHAEVVALLLDAGASVRTRVDHGRTALHLAAFGGYGAVLESLLAAGARRDVRDERGRLALHYAALAAEPDAIDPLLSDRGTLALADEHGWTPLHVAVAAGRLEAVRRLVRGGADLEARTISGSTALHLAGRHADAAMLQLLLDGGGDPRAEDFLGRTPREILTRRQAPRRGAGSPHLERESGPPPEELRAPSETPAVIFSSWKTYCPGTPLPPRGCDLALWSDGVLLFSAERGPPNQGLRIGKLSRERMVFLWRELEEVGALGFGEREISGPGTTVRTLRFRRAGARYSLGAANRPASVVRTPLLSRFEVVHAHWLASDLLELAIPDASWAFEDLESEGSFRGYDPRKPRAWSREWQGFEPR